VKEEKKKDDKPKEKAMEAVKAKAAEYQKAAA
jgi:hypothetical protein